VEQRIDPLEGALLGFDENGKPLWITWLRIITPGRGDVAQSGFDYLDGFILETFSERLE